jgi:hypothetical protein
MKKLVEDFLKAACVNRAAAAAGWVNSAILVVVAEL